MLYRVEFDAGGDWTVVKSRVHARTPFAAVALSCKATGTYRAWALDGSAPTLWKVPSYGMPRQLGP